MAGGLFDPLGPGGVPGVGTRRFRVAPVAAIGIIALVSIVLVATVLRDDGNRGEPRAVSTIQHVIQLPPAPAPPVIAAAPALPSSASSAAVPPPVVPALPATSSDQEVEVQNGVRIIRPRRSGSMPSQVLTVPGGPPAKP